jgi:hypothetical protein
MPPLASITGQRQGCSRDMRKTFSLSLSPRTTWRRFSKYDIAGD